MKCFLSFHKWNGCVCARCGAKRNEQHDWNGCTCRRCGAKRDQGHDWNGCRCRICGKQRDKGHKYKYTPYDETRCKGTCKVCGAETLIAHHFEQAEGKCREMEKDRAIRQNLQHLLDSRIAENRKLKSRLYRTEDALREIPAAKSVHHSFVNGLLMHTSNMLRLADFLAGQYAEVISVLKFPQFKASFPNEMLDLWSKAMHEQIRADFDAERYTPAMENTKYLLIYFPDDEAGLDYIEMIQTIRRHEKAGDRK